MTATAQLRGIRLSAGLTALIGLVGLAGWLFRLGPLLGFPSNRFPIAPLAVLVILLLAYVLPVAGKLWKGPRLRRAAIACCGLAMLLCTMAALRPVFSALGEPELWFFRFFHIEGHTQPHMYPATALLFLASAVALGIVLTSRPDAKVPRYVAAWLGLGVLAAAFLALFGYLERPSVDSPLGRPVALLSALCLLGLAPGILAAVGGRPWPLSQLAGNSTRALLLRALLPVVLGIMAAGNLVSGWASLGSSRAVPLALTSVAVLAVTTWVIHLIAADLGGRIDRAEQASQRARSDLRESDLRMREMSEAAPYSILALELAGAGQLRITGCNRRFAKALATDEQRLLGRDLTEILPEITFGGFLDRLLKALNEGIALDLEEIAVDTGRFHGVYEYSTAPAGAGKLTLFIRDITEKKRAEQELKLLAHTLRSINECVSITDAADRIMFANRAFLNTYGYRPEEVSGQNSDLIRSSKNPPELIAQIYPGTLAGGWQGELINRRKDGSEFPVALSTSVVRDDQGRPLGLVGVASDISERKRWEEERARLSLVLEQTAEGLMITDVHGIIQYVNPAFERMTGYARQEALGSTPRILRSGKQEAAFYKEMWETVLAGRVWSGRVVNRRKNGQTYPEDLTISPVKDAAGRVLHFAAVKRDISKVVALEEQLRQAQKMEAVGRLAGGVAHDFNNLLTVISGYCELLLMRAGAQETSRKQLESIREAANRAASLTQQLLAYSRKQVLQPRPLNLNQLISDTGKMIERLIGEDVQLVTSLAPDLGWVKADPNQILQVIVNLAANARDALPQGGLFTIETANVELDEDYAGQHPDVTAGPHVEMTVSDDGIGMARETLDRIFEPFFTTKEAGKGTGLGLATVYGIIRQSKGHICAASEPGEGTSFRIYLPRIPAPADAVPGGSPQAAARGSETVLVVEDEEAVRLLIREILVSRGYEVMDAPNGAQAIEMARACGRPLHLVLTDVVMPQMSGPEVVAALRRIHPEARVLYASGFTDRAVIHHGILESQAAFIQKPFSPESLAQRIRQVLNDAK